MMGVGPVQRTVVMVEIIHRGDIDTGTVEALAGLPDDCVTKILQSMPEALPPDVAAALVRDAGHTDHPLLAGQPDSLDMRATDHYAGLQARRAHPAVDAIAGWFITQGHNAEAVNTFLLGTTWSRFIGALNRLREIIR
jgi:hypothetical protein